MHRPERRPEPFDKLRTGSVEGPVEGLRPIFRPGFIEGHRPALAYGLFTFLSCFLELGLVVDAVTRGPVLSPSKGRPLWELGILLLAFHVATLLTHLLIIPWPFVSLRTGPARGGSLAVGCLLLLAHPGGVVGTAMGVFLARLGLQYMRNDLKTQARPGARYKALPRLAGFILAFLYSPPAFAILGAVTVGVYLLSSVSEHENLEAYERQGGKGTGGPFDRLRAGQGDREHGSSARTYLTMAAHSAHYFAFGYGVPALFAGRYGFSVASLGLVYTTGWLGYYLISRLLPPSPRYLAWGHLASVLGILVLAFSPTPWPALLAWTITGFGGGTIFMLSRLRASNQYDPAAMDLWDNGANIVGLLLFLWTWGRGVPVLGFLAAASLALAAAWAAAGLQEIPHKATAPLPPQTCYQAMAGSSVRAGAQVAEIEHLC